MAASEATRSRSVGEEPSGDESPQLQRASMDADASAAPVPAANKAGDASVTAERAPVRRTKTKLPQECVDWILAQKRNFVDEDPDEYYDRMINDPDRHEIYTQQFIEEETQLLRDMASFYERCGDRLEKFQRWVRRQLDTKGYVEIEDVYLDQAINYRESLKKLCDAMEQVPGFIHDGNDAVKQLAKQQAMEVPGLIYDRDDVEF